MSQPIDPTKNRCAGPAYGPWTDPSRRSKTAVVALVVVLYLLVVDVLWRIVGMVTVGGLVEAPSDLWFERFDLVTTILGWVYLASLAVAAATFIRWQRTTIRNLPFLGCEKPEYGIGIASFGWFIPLVNLALPLICLHEVARWSRPPATRSSSALLGWWWGLWIVANTVLTAASMVYQIGTTTESWIAGATTDAVGTLLLIATGVLAVKLVRTLTSWQTRLRAARAEDRSRGSEGATIIATGSQEMTSST